MSRLDDIRSALHDRIVAILQKFQDAAAVGDVGDLSDVADQVIQDMRDHAKDLLEYLSNFAPHPDTEPVTPPDPATPPIGTDPVPEPPLEVPPTDGGEVPVDPVPVPPTPPEAKTLEDQVREVIAEALGELDATDAELTALSNKILAVLKANAQLVYEWLDNAPQINPENKGKR